jgi:hypothetical protein
MLAPKLYNIYIHIHPTLPLLFCIAHQCTHAHTSDHIPIVSSILLDYYLSDSLSIIQSAYKMLFSRFSKATMAVMSGVQSAEKNKYREILSSPVAQLRAMYKQHLQKQALMTTSDKPVLIYSGHQLITATSHDDSGDKACASTHPLSTLHSASIASTTNLTSSSISDSQNA